MDVEHQFVSFVSFAAAVHCVVATLASSAQVRHDENTRLFTRARQYDLAVCMSLEGLTCRLRSLYTARAERIRPGLRPEKPATSCAIAPMYSTPGVALRV